MHWLKYDRKTLSRSAFNLPVQTLKIPIQVPVTKMLFDWKILYVPLTTERRLNIISSSSSSSSHVALGAN